MSLSEWNWNFNFEDSIKNKDSDLLISKLEKSSYIKFYESLETNGLIIKNNNSKGVLIKGYDTYDKLHYLSNSLINGSKINDRNNEIIIGDALANQLNVSVGSKIKIAIPKTDKTILVNLRMLINCNVGLEHEHRFLTWIHLSRLGNLAPRWYFA